MEVKKFSDIIFFLKHPFVPLAIDTRKSKPARLAHKNKMKIITFCNIQRRRKKLKLRQTFSLFSLLLSLFCLKTRKRMQTRKEEKTVPNKLCDYIRKRVLK